MSLISREVVERVLAATDIVDLISSYIPVKRAGTGHKALCPFHNEKSPSFNISQPKQVYKCFGCGASGNAITFVMEHEGLLFKDAVRKLAAKASIPIEEEPDDPKAKAARRSRGKLLELHRDTAAFFHQLLKTDPACQHARDYLKSRGFGQEMAERWQIGWMPENSQHFLNWVREKKYTGKDLIAAGLAALRDENQPNAGLYVRFRDRLMFPIRNEAGDVIAFSGRQLRDDPKSGKYINSPETDIFKKSNVLFALDRAKQRILKEKQVILCEGQIDVIACHENGVTHAIAPLGTAFTSQHARIIKRYAQIAVLCFDGDSAGIKACERAFRELTPEGISVKIILLPKGDDPDTFIKAQGADAFNKRVHEALDFFDFKFETARLDRRLDSVEGRTELSRECNELLALMGDHAARDQQINIVSSMLGIGAATLRESIASSIRKAKLQAQRPLRVNRDETPSHQAVEPIPLDRTVAYLCHLALSSPQAQHFLAEQFETIHEAKSWMEGISLLEKIIAAAPDTSSSSAVNAFIVSLRKSEQLALNQSIDRVSFTNSDDLQATEAALGMLSAIVLQKRDAAVKAALKEPGIAIERMLELLQEAKEIAALLRWTGRSTFDDELAPETQKAEKKPWEKWKKK